MQQLTTLTRGHLLQTEVQLQTIVLMLGQLKGIVGQIGMQL